MNNKKQQPYKNKLGTLKHIRLTELAENLHYDYRHLLTKIRNIEKKHSVLIVTKEDDKLKKAPFYVNTEILFGLVPQLSPLEDDQDKYNRIKELECKVAALEDILIVNGILKQRTELF